MRLSLGDLRLGNQVGVGSQGSVHQVRDPQAYGLPFGGLIYKQFSDVSKVSGHALEVLAAMRDAMPDAEKQVLDNRTVWPVATVQDKGRVTGYLMQEIPAWFRQPIAATTGRETIPREIQHLFVSEELARRNLGEAPNRLERLAVARELAFVMGFLHRKQLVFGDLSYRNEVYALRPRPAVMLLDCDAVRVRGQGSAVPQLNSPGWGAPEKGAQTISTDRYKLGLFVLRCVTPGVNAQNRNPDKASGVLDRDGMTLLRRAVGADADHRTTGREWVTYLDAAITRGGGVRVREGWIPAPAPPPRLAEAGVHHRAAISVRYAAHGRVAGTAAAPRWARHPQIPPLPQMGAAVRGRRVMPSQVLGGFPGATSTGPSAFGTGWAQTASAATGMHVWTILFLGGLALVVTAVLGLSFRAPGTPVARPRPTTTTIARGPVFDTTSVAKSADSAVLASRRAAGAGWKVVSLSTEGALGAPLGLSPASFTPAVVPSRWVVQLVRDDVTGTGDVALQNYVVDWSGVSALPSTTVQDPGRAATTTLPAEAGSAVQRAMSNISGALPAESSKSGSLAWVCGPPGSSPSGCYWRFSTDEGRVVLVSADGLRILPAPPS